MEPSGKTEEIRILPQEILTAERYNIRPFSTGKDGDGEVELASLERLADSIELHGQLYPGLAYKKLVGGQVKYVLLGGHRRRRAIILLNTRRSRQMRPLMYMCLRIVEAGADYDQICISDNIQRQNLSPMDLALLIKRLRESNGWQLRDCNGKLAKYLGVSVATVTQHEKFSKTNVHLQKLLHNGTVSADTALTLLGLTETQQTEILKRAGGIGNVQTETEEAHNEATENTPTETEHLETGKTLTTRIEKPAVVRAMREMGIGGPVPRTKKEIVEWFQALDGPAYGGPDSGVRRFVKAFGQWTSGETVDLMAAFDLMALDKGTMVSESQPKSNLLVMPIEVVQQNNTEIIPFSLQA